MKWKHKMFCFQISIGKHCWLNKIVRCCVTFDEKFRTKIREKVVKSWETHVHKKLEGSRVNYSMVVQDCPKRKNSLVIWIFDGEKRDAYHWNENENIFLTVCVTLFSVNYSHHKAIFTFWTILHNHGIVNSTTL